MSWDWGALVEALILFGIPASVLLGFGVWALRRQGIVQATGVVLTALGTIIALFMLAAILFSVPTEIIGVE